jgi:hypothetical protein
MERNIQFVKSHVPEALMPNGYASASVVAWVMYQKYANAVPLYRQEKDWNQMGVLFNRATLANWVIYCAKNYFTPLLLWSSVFVTLVASKFVGLLLGVYWSCQIMSRVFYTAPRLCP